MLLESDYPMGIECKNGMTAIQIAAFKGHSEILEIIVYYAYHSGKKYLKKIINKVNS